MSTRANRAEGACPAPTSLSTTVSRGARNSETRRDGQTVTCPNLDEHDSKHNCTRDAARNRLAWRRDPTLPRYAPAKPLQHECLRTTCMKGNGAMTAKSTLGLHLPELAIKGFRGIEDLVIPELGRVTLIAGENGVGKTTVLEAAQVYASRGRERVLSALLRRHEEFASAIDEDDDRIDMPSPAALFHGWRMAPGSTIEIGPAEGRAGGKLTIEAGAPDAAQMGLFRKLRYEIDPDDSLLSLKTTFTGYERILPWLVSPQVRVVRSRDYSLYRRRADEGDTPPTELACRVLGPGMLDNDAIAELWDAVALTDGEDFAIRGLSLALKDRVDRVAMVGDHDLRYRDPRYRSAGRRVAVKLRGRNTRVPLRSLGDGAVRLFGIALSLVSSRNGFLVIDEVENGIHHSVLRDFWAMVLQASADNDVQVLATTHSSDCIKAFAHAAVDTYDSDGVLVRLERAGSGHRAVVYPETELEIAAEQRIEVR